MAAQTRAARPVRVLVTGAAGFVGYGVAAALVEAGHEVFGMARAERPLPVGVRRVPGNVLEPESVVRAVVETAAEGVCHLAALPRVRDSRADPLTYWRTNVGGTLAVLQ